MNGLVTGTLGGMKRSAILLAAVGLFFGATDIVGQSAGAPSPYVNDDAAAASWSQVPDVDILSDTQGVDFGPYLRKALPTVKKMWQPLIPEEARPPLNIQANTAIRFTINPDGTIGSMHLDGGSHQAKFDRAAWGAIIGVGQFPPLPADFHGPYLELRIHFFVNTPHAKATP
jgi:TonB family protein